MNTYTIAQRMLNAAICAYSIDLDGGFKPEAKYYDTLNLENDPTVIVEGKDGINACFVGTTREDSVTGEKWIVLSLRGTLGSFKWSSWKSIHAFLEDWLQDDESKMEPFEVNGSCIGNATKGFKRAMMSLWSDIQSALSNIDLSQYTGIQIAGHSKGAALTFLAAALIKASFSEMASIHVHAYAAPLAGDPKFASWYNDHNLDVSTTRYQRADDIVPFLPPSKEWNIFHHLPNTFHPKGILLESVLKLLSLQVYGGYQEVGTLVGLTTEDKGGKVITNAEVILQQSITHAISHGRGGNIASAHSAIDSYWPAMFNEKQNEE